MEACLSGCRAISTLAGPAGPGPCLQYPESGECGRSEAQAPSALTQYRSTSVDPLLEPTPGEPGPVCL